MKITKVMGFAACGLVSVFASASLADDPVVFQGAKNSDAVIAKKDKWFKPYFGWGNAYGYSIWTPSDGGLADGYSVLARPEYWDGEPISSEKDYLIKNNYSAPCAPSGGTTTFGGRSLTIGTPNATDKHTASGYDSETTMGWLTPGSGTVVFENDGVICVNGGFFNRGVSPTINGKITIEAVESNPFWFYSYSWSNLDWTFNASISGAKGTAVRARIAGSSGGNYMNWKFNGDLSGYYGLLDIGNGANIYFGATAGHLPGKLKVGSATTIQPATSDLAGEMRLGSLEFTSSDATLTSFTAANDTFCLLRVDDSLVLPEDGRPKLRYALPNLLGVDGSYWDVKVTNLVERQIELVNVPASVPALDSVFDMANAKAYKSLGQWESGRVSAYDLSERVEGDRRIFAVDIPKCTYQSVSWSSSRAKRPFDAGANDMWWNGMAPADNDPDTAYFIAAEKESSLPVADSYEFPGRKLILAWCSKMRQFGDATIGSMVWHPQVNWMSWASTRNRKKNTLRGNLVLQFDPGSQPDSEDDKSYRTASTIQADRTLAIDANISGDGLVYLVNGDSVGYGCEKGNARIELNGNNSGFYGKFRIYNRYASEGYFTDVCASNACGFGGAGCWTNSFKALDLRAGGRLVATASLELNEPTRGVYVNGKGAIKVENAADTFALRSQLTMNGELEKYGPGTLALGGALRFSSEQAIEPMSELNILTIKEGALRGLSKGAVDGLNINFHPGTFVEIASPAETISADEEAFGLYNAKGYLNVGAAEGILSVRLSEKDRFDADGNDLWPDAFTRAICTVNNDAVYELDGSIRFVGLPRGVKLRGIRSVANADGATTTFVADFKRSGFAIIVR